MNQKRGGARLRAWLKDERRSQQWLADQIGSSQTNVSAWSHPRTPRPIPLEMALKIERLTGIEVEEWVAEAAPLSSTGTD